MGHMNWIYAMIQDNSYHAFKMITLTAQENKVDKFKWGNSWIDTVYATYVVKFVENKVKQTEEKKLEKTDKP